MLALQETREKELDFGALHDPAKTEVLRGSHFRRSHQGLLVRPFHSREGLATSA